MGKPSAPPPPDYKGAALEEGAQSRDTALFNTNINRANQVGPYGSSTWQFTGKDPKNPQAGDYTQTTTLNPEQQKLLDSTNQISQAFLNTGNKGLTRVDEAMGKSFDTSGLPALQTVGGLGQQQQAPNTASTSQLPQLGGDYEASRRRVEDALLSRTNRSLDQSEAATRARLLNSGIEQGSEAWQREMQNAGQTRNDATMQAVIAGGQEQSRLANQANVDRGQLFGERSQQYQQGLASAGFNNDAAYKEFLAGQQAATTNNQVRGQGIQEQAYLRSLPLNEVNALRTGSQASMPNFSGYYTGGSAQTPQLLNASVAQGNYGMQAYQGQQSGYNALMGGLANLGGAAIMSDARLKTNLQRIGGDPRGFGYYTWNWRDGSGKSAGVIAQEVRGAIPGAVTEGADGILRVNYGKL